MANDGTDHPTEGTRTPRLLRSPALRWAVPVGAVVAIGAGVALTSGNADAAAQLPPKTAAQLLVDLAQAPQRPLSGTVVETAKLGLPELPTMAGGGTSLQSLVTEWTWRAQLPPGADATDAGARVAGFLARESFPWEQQRDKDIRRYDLRALVLDLAVEEMPDGAALRARFKAEAVGRPEQLAAALCYDPREVRIHRLALHLQSPTATTA